MRQADVLIFEVQLCLTGCRLLVRLILSVMVLGLGSCRAAMAAEDALNIPVFWDVKERISKPDLSAVPRMRFLTTTDFPPFNSIDSTGELFGFNIDLVRAICAELKIAEKCQIQALPWSELEGALARGDGEAIIAGLAVTAQTRLKYAFSRSYLRFPARFIMRADAALEEPLAAALKKKRVGVVAGTAHERLLRDDFPGLDIVPYPAQAAMLQDLREARIDAGFGDGMRLAFWLETPDAQGCCRLAGESYLAPDYLGSGLAIATSLGHPQYAAAFDAALQQISAKGVFAELYLRAFPVGFY